MDMPGPNRLDPEESLTLAKTCEKAYEIILQVPPVPHESNGVHAEFGHFCTNLKLHIKSRPAL
ncbi:2798_t:CDS:2 [Gigaspora rosea]|nr:2798_t:CDS:2 [Gigaspora rosea]